MATIQSPADMQLAAFLDRFTPEIAAEARAARRAIRSLLPSATELVYDNYNALVIGYGPSDQSSGAFLSLALYPRWVTLFFLQGAALPDPEGLLEGNGSTGRGIRLTGGAADLSKPAIGKLIAAAITTAKVPLAANTKSGGLVIKAISEKLRPRRPR